MLGLVVPGCSLVPAISEVQGISALLRWGCKPSNNKSPLLLKLVWLSIFYNWVFVFLVSRTEVLEHMHFLSAIWHEWGCLHQAVPGFILWITYNCSFLPHGLLFTFGETKKKGKSLMIRNPISCCGHNEHCVLFHVSFLSTETRTFELLYMIIENLHCKYIK